MTQNQNMHSKHHKQQTCQNSQAVTIAFFAEVTGWSEDRGLTTRNLCMTFG